MTILPVVLCFWISLITKVNCANSTQAYSSYGLTQAILLDLGSDIGINGFEVNFWMKPIAAQANTGSANFMMLLNAIELSYQYNVTGVTTNYIQTKYGGKNQQGYFPVAVPPTWMNINCRIYFNSYIMCNGWTGGNLNADPNPTFTCTHMFPTLLSNLTIQLSPTTSDFYVNVAELRVFELDPNYSYGQFLKFYGTIWPVSSFKLQRQYLTIFGNLMYLDINDATQNKTIADYTAFALTRCAYGKYLAANGTCINCTQTDCLICPPQNNNFLSQCKICNTTVNNTSCSPLLECPTDYYNYNGNCLRCPPGCASCISGKNCTTCDANLNLINNSTHQTCQCAAGKYGTPDYTTDTMVCASCSGSCKTCDFVSTNCTSCNSPSFLYGNNCVLDCALQANYSYGNSTDRLCYPCGTNCQSCTNSTYCNLCINNATVTTWKYNGKCMSPCPDNTLTDNSTMSCISCASNCAHCLTTPSNCDVCNSNYFLNAASCISACPNGKFPDASFACQNCPTECVLCGAASYCTVCQPTYYFVNYQCVLTCPDRYYPDSSNPSSLFCRSCPSGCATCDSEKNCTSCDAGYIIDTTFSGTQRLCVTDCQKGFFYDIQNSSAADNNCTQCITNCEKCSTASNCHKCSLGYVLSTGPSCISSCPATTFADNDNVCQTCISGCSQCSNNLTCDSCTSGYLLVEGLKTCILAPCPNGYYQNSGKCSLCKPECLTCSSGSTCNTCIVGYSLSSSQCAKKCGNGQREDQEDCDDANQISGDGCTSTCFLESGYVCMPLNPASSGPDICYCDANFISGVWADHWGTIIITFQSNIIYYSATTPKSNDPLIFCSQILDPSIVPQLGTEYSCFLNNEDIQTILKINVDTDSTLGNTVQAYQTQIILNAGVLRVDGCTVGIPISYNITNMPLDTPIVYFQSLMNSLIVPKCAPYYALNIFSSKGFTKRDIGITWSLLSMTPPDMTYQSTLSSLFTTYSNIKLLSLFASDIESLAGKSLSLKSTVTNFLGNSGSNQTTLSFSSIKQLMIVDLQDIYTFQVDMNNTISPRIRLPYCASEDSSTQTADLKMVTTTCILYKADMTKATPLINCTIKAYNMTLGQSFKVRVTATHSKDPTLTVSKIVHIDTASPAIKISYIDGCDRLFATTSNFELEAMITTNITYARFTWYCTDTSTGSPCFTTTYSYITIANTKKVSIPGTQFFPNNTYLFKVNVQDTLSLTSTTLQCLMYSAPKSQKVMALKISTEANRNGYIDFNAQMAAFKAQIMELSLINKSKLKYTWKITDSSMVIFDNTKLSIYQNSIGVPITMMERSNIYTVEVNITDGTYYGYMKTDYQTEPEMSFEFAVQPYSGEAHSTIFTFSVTSQDTLDGLYQYVFGYVNPSESSSSIPIYQKSTNRYQRTQLPEAASGSSTITCYVQIMLPSGDSKTFYQDVTMSSPTITVSDFKSQLSSAVMDDLVESMQIKNKLVTLRSQMAVTDIAAAMKKILLGLQGETTPLSDYYIQSSVASLLEYISTESEALMTDGTLVSIAAALFQQMTIDENKMMAQGKYSQFIRSATVALFNFANNLFQKDFSSLIGASKSQFLNSCQSVKQTNEGHTNGRIKECIKRFPIKSDSWRCRWFLLLRLKYVCQSCQMQVSILLISIVDQLENFYNVTAALPRSLNGTLSQNFVNITLPAANSSSNPCRNFSACQVSIIILDQPTNTFISNSKESTLKSMFIDISISSTEVSSPQSYIQIQDINVVNLVDPIKITIPLNSALNTTNPNRTLGCGYLDETDQIFKTDGITINKINNNMVTCLASHLTQIGVEEYTGDLSTTVNDTVVVTPVELSDSDADLKQVNIWKSWAIYVSIALIIILGVGVLWGYRKDKREELVLDRIRSEKNKIYVGVYLDPIITVQKDKYDKQESEKLVTSSKQTKNKKTKEKKTAEAYEFLDNQVDETMRNSMLLPNTKSPPPIVLEPYKQHPMEDAHEIHAEMDDMNMTGMSRKSKKTVKKKKKKKKKAADGSPDDDGFDMHNTMNEFRQNRKFGAGAQESIRPQHNADAALEHNIFFEGGDIEFGVEFEGGSDDELNITEAAAETIKSKRSKKKKKKNAMRQSKISRQNSMGAESVKSGGIEIEDLNETMKSARSAKSAKSGKSTGKKKKKNKMRSTSKKSEKAVEEDDGIKFNSQFGGFNMKKGPTKKEDDLGQTERSSRSVKKTKSLKRKGSRASSRGSSRSSNGRNDRPDAEAEEIAPKKKNSAAMEHTNKSDLFKPVADDGQKKKKKKKQKNADALAIHHTAAADEENIHPHSEKRHETKGFETLMNEDIGAGQNVGGDMVRQIQQQQDQASNKAAPKRSKTAAAKPKKFQRETAGCCVFCIWNCRQGHRICQLIRHYNDYLSRPSRMALFIMSLFQLMMITGFLIDAPNFIAEKTVRNEQFICGFAAAAITKIWVIVLTNIMRHTKREKVYVQVYNSQRARNIVRCNLIRYWFGVALIILSILLSLVFVFMFSATMIGNLINSWGWAYLFSVFADFVLIEGIVVIFATVNTLLVGSAPDSCGKCRNCWIGCIPQAVKDAVK